MYTICYIFDYVFNKRNTTRDRYNTKPKYHSKHRCKTKKSSGRLFSRRHIKWNHKYRLYIMNPPSDKNKENEHQCYSTNNNMSNNENALDSDSSPI